MNKYVVIANSGTAFDESDNEVFCCIHLGTFQAPDKTTAIHLAKKECDEFGQDFSTYDMIAYKLDDREKI